MTGNRETTTFLIDANSNGKTWVDVFGEHSNELDTETLSSYLETMDSSELLEKYTLPAKLLQAMCRLSGPSRQGNPFLAQLCKEPVFPPPCTTRAPGRARRHRWRPGLSQVGTAPLPA